MNSLHTYKQVFEKKNTFELKQITLPKEEDIQNTFLMIYLLFAEAGLLSPISLRRIYTLQRQSKHIENQSYLILLIEKCLCAGDTRLTLPTKTDALGNYLNSVLKSALFEIDCKLKTPHQKDGLKSFLLNFYQENLNEVVAEYQKIILPLLDNLPSLFLRIDSQSSHSEQTNSVCFLVQQHTETHLYYNRLWKDEQIICEQSGQRLQDASLVVDDFKLRDALKEVLQTYTLRSGEELNSKYFLNARQALATVLSCKNRTTFITGGPGTGKTSVVVQILRVLRRIEANFLDHVFLCAPTGRAAARLQESISKGLAGLKYYPEYASDEQLKEDLKLEFIQGTTVHRLLKYQMSNATYKFNKENPLKAKLVVLDEASMLDLHLFSALLQALPLDCRLIILGDRNQLPSVDSGAVLGDISDIYYSGDLCTLSSDKEKELVGLLPPQFAPSKNLSTQTKHILQNNMIILNESHRSEKSILTLAEAINNESASLVKKSLTSHPSLLADETLNWPQVNLVDGQRKCLPSGIRHIQLVNDDPKSIEPLLRSWCLTHYSGSTNPHFPSNSDFNTHLQAIQFIDQLYQNNPDQFSRHHRSDSPAYKALKRLQTTLDSGRILCVTKEGYRGSKFINQMIAKEMFQASEGESPDLFSGLPIMINQNSPTINLFNGDTGILLKTPLGMFASFARVDEFELVPLHFLPDWSPCFAMTIHKSQGSEFDHVLMVLPEQKNRLMTREILYTGITRAKYFCGILGSIEIFAESCTQRIQRNSGIPDYLKGLTPSK